MVLDLVEKQSIHIEQIESQLINLTSSIATNAKSNTNCVKI